MDYARPLSHTTIRPTKLGDSDNSVKIMFVFVPSIQTASVLVMLVMTTVNHRPTVSSVPGLTSTG